MFDSVIHGMQHARLPCPSPSPEFAQVHVHWIGDSIQLFHLCHPLLLLLQSFPATRAFSVSQLFTSGGPKYWSFSCSISPSNDYWVLISLKISLKISLQSKGILRVFYSTTIQKHQFFGVESFLWSKSHLCTWLLERP